MGAKRQSDVAVPGEIAAFVARWQGREGGQERANYAMFLSELCAALLLRPPDPAGERTDHNDYVFERVVRETTRDGSVSHRRIDLYKRDCFVLEAKQSRQQEGGEKQVRAQKDLFAEPPTRGRRGATRGWDVLMLNARQQAENYVRFLPQGHEPPPFVIVCDVGHCFEIYANFRRDGKAYDQFPDRLSFRIFLEDLLKPEKRALLSAIWTDPLALDPARRSARVTREIAERLAKVSRALEKHAYPAQDVAMFLMRCLFTMFSENVGLLPENAFIDLLTHCVERPDAFPHDVSQLWEAMDLGQWAHAIRHKVRRFNGEFFRNRQAFALEKAEIGELLAAARYDWRDVDPSIFGALLEQALDPVERRKLGAHYTPRAYVERLVSATVIDPLREDWSGVLATVERQRAKGRAPAALAQVRAFHEKLCATRVLDPACGTGNFLYVSLEMLKRLEGEVLEVLADLGGQEALSGLEGHSVDPHQFLGLEINPRAAAIAELVLWIGHLQWHIRTKGGLPDDPVLKAFRNIVVRDAVLEADKVLSRDAAGRPLGEVYEYRNPRRPVWPEAEFIVGNPPFIGGKDLRARMGDDYAKALWAAHLHMNESADFVMYWWDRAAELLTRKGTSLRRFGLVTTNSISQVFQRRVMERHLSGKTPVSIVMAIADHPWTKMTKDAAAVRIAMTVVVAGSVDGVLREVVRETGLETDAPVIEFVERAGKINSDLTVGVDLESAAKLISNDGMAARGVVLHGSGFIISEAKARHLGLGRRPGLEAHIKDYRNGRDLMARSRDFKVIDLFGLDISQIVDRFPEIYQHVKLEVKEKTLVNKRGEIEKVGRDWNNREYRRLNWWLFGENIPELRNALKNLNRFIATVETAKHRVFQFLDASILPDNMLVAIGSEDAFALGVLSSHVHVVWALRAGGWLGVGNDPRYSKSRCFDPFPFPLANDRQKQRIRALAEDLDAHRKRVLAEHPHLTLTGLYNVREKLRAGARPGALDPADRQIFDDGLVLILNELHDKIDAAVADAYGWPADLAQEAILANLVALNKARAQEEARGLVHWLRPEYQIPRFGTARDKAELALEGGAMAVPVAVAGRAAFPADDRMQTAAVMAALAAAPGPLDARTLAAQFRGRKVEENVAEILASLVRTGYVATAGDAGFAMGRLN